jgi:hypothetical protein
VAAVFAGLVLRELCRRDARRLAGNHLSHEVGNALQILVDRIYLHPDQREQLEDEAIERIRAAARGILPHMVGMPANGATASPSSLGEGEAKRKSSRR